MLGWLREPGALDRLVNEATARITRLDAPEAFLASAADAVIIDIRSQDSRELYGVIPGSLHIPRTVLEWRVAVDSPWRNAHLGGLDQQLMLICDHGYSSILGASNLVQLGFYRAGTSLAGSRRGSTLCFQHPHAAVDCSSRGPCQGSALLRIPGNLGLRASSGLRPEGAGASEPGGRWLKRFLSAWPSVSHGSAWRVARPGTSPLAASWRFAARLSFRYRSRNAVETRSTIARYGCAS